MEGISKKRLKAILHNQIITPKTQSFVQYLIEDECQELQEPWMPLDEFLKSGFEGECWICLDKEEVYRATYLGKENGFRNIHGHFFRWRSKHITHVMPIHKPELPR